MHDKNLASKIIDGFFGVDNLDLLNKATLYYINHDFFLTHCWLESASFLRDANDSTKTVEQNKQSF